MRLQAGASSEDVVFPIAIEAGEGSSPKRFVQDAEFARAVALHQVAEEAKSSFIEAMEGIAGAGGGVFSAGTQEEGYPFAVKSEESAQRKVEDRVREDIVEASVNSGEAFPSYVENMGDMLRGTIVVDDYGGMVAAARKLGEEANGKGWAVSIENKFSGEAKGGYVGLHFNIGYQTPHGMISTEMQIHTKRNLEVKEKLSHCHLRSNACSGS
jgi:hypothetical protein